MRSQEKQKTWFQRILNSKLVLIGSLILLVVISVALSKAIHKRYQIQKEIKAIKEEVEEAEGKNRELSQLIGYLSTDNFREKMARQKLNLKRAGETVVAIPVLPESEKSILGNINEQEPEKTPVANKWDNPKKWWHYLFSHY